jgi:hypothetical protein
MNVWVVKPFNLWMGFIGTTKFVSSPRTNIKWCLYVLGVNFHTGKFLFSLRIMEPLFSGPCFFSFHDLKHIVKVYLDDIASRYHKISDHPTHLRLIFERCRYYQILLNPNKCSFCVTLSHMLGFIISTKGIMVDLMKVEEIVQLPPPCTIP